MSDEETVRGASTSQVVHGLSDAYGLGHVAAAGLGTPCGVNEASFPYWGLYAYAPSVGQWDCFEGETFAVITGPYLRSPCVCQGLPSERPSLWDALMPGMLAGIFLLATAVALGRLWGSIDSKENGVLWCIIGAILSLIDEVTDLAVLYQFWHLEQWGFFHISATVLVLSSLIMAFLSLQMGVWGSGLWSDVMSAFFGFAGFSPALMVFCKYERENFSYLKAAEAIFESLPQFELQMVVITLEGWRHAWAQQRLLLFSGFSSLVGLGYSLTTLFAHVANCRTRCSSKVVQMGVLLFFASDVGLRTLAVSTLAYAADDWPFWFGASHFIWWLCVLWQGCVGLTITVFTLMHLQNGRDEWRAFLNYVVAFDCVLTFSMIYIGMLPWMPHPHVDPTFIQSIYISTIAGLTCKISSYFWVIVKNQDMKTIWCTTAPYTRSRNPGWAVCCCFCDFFEAGGDLL